MTDLAASSKVEPNRLFDALSSSAIGVHVTTGWQTIPQFASDLGRTPRTVNRWIGLGLSCAVVRIGRTPMIDPIKARIWFEKGMPPPKSPTRPVSRRWA
jgi:hypothetical protein